MISINFSLKNIRKNNGALKQQIYLRLLLKDYQLGLLLITIISMINIKGFLLADILRFLKNFLKELR